MARGENWDARAKSFRVFLLGVNAYREWASMVPGDDKRRLLQVQAIIRKIADVQH